MLVLRCTERLRKRLKRDNEPGASTTALGDWYRNLLHVGRRQLLLFISERSRLPVFLPATDAKHLERALPAAVEEMLTLVGAHPDAIVREVQAMSPLVVARTTNRSVVGSMNECAWMARFRIEDEPGTPPFELARGIVNMPILPLDGAAAIDLTRRVLGPAPGLTMNPYEDPDGRWRPKP
jgi:hypothetical protein